MPTKDYRGLTKGREPFEIILEDRTIVLPKVLPMKVLTDMAALDLEDADDATQQETIAFGMTVLETVINHDRPDNWQVLQSEIGGEAISLMTDVLHYYDLGGKKDKAEDGEDPKAQAKPEKEKPAAKPPAKGEKESASPSEISSGSGQHSTPTSNGTSPTLGADSIEPPSLTLTEIGESSSPESETSPQNPPS